LSNYDGLLPPIQAYIRTIGLYLLHYGLMLIPGNLTAQPPEYSWRTQSLDHRPDAFYASQAYTGYPTMQSISRAPSPTDLSLAYRHSPAYPPHPVLAPMLPQSVRGSLPVHVPAQGLAHVPEVARSPPAQMTQLSSHDLQRLQSQETLYEHFRQYSLQAVLSAFLQMYAPSQATSTPNASPQALTDPSVPMVARIRTLSARAVAYRKAFGNKNRPSTADYARRLISPLWDGLPVGLALSTCFVWLTLINNRLTSSLWPQLADLLPAVHSVWAAKFPMTP
jgi:hypothetical protein